MTTLAKINIHIAGSATDYYEGVLASSIKKNKLALSAEASLCLTTKKAVYLRKSFQITIQTLHKELILLRHNRNFFNWFYTAIFRSRIILLALSNSKRLLGMIFTVHFNNKRGKLEGKPREWNTILKDWRKEKIVNRGVFFPFSSLTDSLRHCDKTVWQLSDRVACKFSLPAVIV